jgi:hypothetical protein
MLSNLVVGAIGANLTFNLVSNAMSTTKKAYGVAKSISNTTESGEKEIVKLIRETDIEVKVATAERTLCEIKTDKNSSDTLKYCLQTTKEAISEINSELEIIYVRMRNNDNRWIGASIWPEKFYDCKSNLEIKINTFESRYSTLLKIIAVEKNIVLVKNKKIDDVIISDVVAVDDVSKGVDNQLINLENNNNSTALTLYNADPKRVKYFADDPLMAETFVSIYKNLDYVNKKRK